MESVEVSAAAVSLKSVDSSSASLASSTAPSTHRVRFSVPSSSREANLVKQVTFGAIGTSISDHSVVQDSGKTEADGSVPVLKQRTRSLELQDGNYGDGDDSPPPPPIHKTHDSHHTNTPTLVPLWLPHHSRCRQRDITFGHGLSLPHAARADADPDPQALGCWPHPLHKSRGLRAGPWRRGAGRPGADTRFTHCGGCVCVCVRVCMYVCMCTRVCGRA